MDIKVLESDCTIEKWVLLKFNKPERLIFFRCWDSARRATQKLRNRDIPYERAVIKMIVLSSGEALIMAGGKGYKQSITDKAFDALLERIPIIKRENNKVINIYPNISSHKAI